MAEETKAAVAEEVKNCPACKKPLKKARRFYRNGAYYCNNNCFKAAHKKATETAVVAAEKAATEKAAAEKAASEKAQTTETREQA